MTITELIEKLNDEYSRYGDIEVCIESNYSEAEPALEVRDGWSISNQRYDKMLVLYDDGLMK